MPALPVTAEWNFCSQCESETDALASRLAAALVPGTVVALVGNLGAGKTRFVRGIAEALGVDRREVASPTFVLIHEYDGRLPIYHFDIYRLRSPTDFLEIGADEYLNSDGVCFVEWADRVEPFLPADHLRVDITATGETTRIFQFTAHGPKSAGIVRELQAG